MKEDFLHFLWRQKLLPVNTLSLVANWKIQILDFGVYNVDSGPDFSNAKVLINDLTWIGNVEIHLKSSDWYVHNHEVDSRYDNVILHVVWEHDAEIFDKNNNVIPTLELKKYLDPNLLGNYYALFTSKQKWILCEGISDFTRNLILTNWLERLYFERLKRNANRMKEILTQSQNDWEYVCFVFLAESFGLHLNKEPFYNLANSVPFHVFERARNCENQLFALVFGQAGFLEEAIQDAYYSQLQTEYRFLQKKYSLQSLHKSIFQFFRTRPSNFPTVRLAQLTSLFFLKKNLFSDLVNSKTLGELYSIFKVSVSEYWQSNYHFDKSSKKSSKSISKSFVDLLIINTILPLKFLYFQQRGEDKTEELLSIISEVKPEKNSIIEKFEKLNFKAENACESQALLELKNNYCTKKRCLQCAIGVRLIKNESLV